MHWNERERVAWLPSKKIPVSELAERGIQAKVKEQVQMGKVLVV
jgi:hypothetical protein